MTKVTVYTAKLDFYRTIEVYILSVVKERCVSPETLLKEPSVQAEASLFSSESFDSYVMNTYGRFAIALERGLGCRVWDTEGRENLDFVAGIATCTLGHAHPAMIAAVTQQIQTLHHVSNLYYIPVQGELAKWLVDHSCADRAFFCNSGAEANEAAIKLARKYAHEKLNISNPTIITAVASFHGRTLATITATGQPKYQKGFSPLVPGFHYVPYNDISAIELAIDELDKDERQVAAIMMEALQGEGGVRPGDIAYFQRIREICDEKGILLILDEVQVGMGRSGKYWGYENLGIEPDILPLRRGWAAVSRSALCCASRAAMYLNREVTPALLAVILLFVLSLCVCAKLWNGKTCWKTCSSAGNS
jgi:acetylornithine/N-succinyldiaminopimelate aminotransferase